MGDLFRPHADRGPAVVSQPSSRALTRGFHFSRRPRRAQRSRDILGGCSRAQGMPQAVGWLWCSRLEPVFTHSVSPPLRSACRAQAPGAVSLPLVTHLVGRAAHLPSFLSQPRLEHETRASRSPPHPGRHLHNVKPLARPPAPHAIPTPPTITTLSRTHHGPHPRGVTLPPALGSEPPEESARSQEPGWGRTQPPTFLHT